MYRQCTTEKSSIQQRKFAECMLNALLQQDYDSISISASAGMRICPGKPSIACLTIKQMCCLLW